MEPIKFSKRYQNIIKRMLKGEAYWSSTSSPRLSKKEYDELQTLGFRIQGSQGWGDRAGAGPVAYYMEDQWFQGNQEIFDRLMNEKILDTD